MILEEIIEIVNEQLDQVKANMKTNEKKYIHLHNIFDEYVMNVINKYFKGQRKKVILAGGGITSIQRSNIEWKITLPAQIPIHMKPICNDLHKSVEEIMNQPEISERTPRIKKKRQRQEDFKEVLDTTLRNFFDNNCPGLSNQEKIRHLLSWRREYAEEVGLSEDLIGRSMKGMSLQSLSSPKLSKNKFNRIWIDY
jgi:hypothetical protein